MPNLAFITRTDRRGESICMACLLTVHANDGITLKEAEGKHGCPSSALIALMRVRQFVDPPMQHVTRAGTAAQVAVASDLGL